MAGYGSGIEFEEACNYDKEKIKAALKRRALVHPEYAAREKKYTLLTKAEADGIILDAYDSAVHTAIDALHCARALEKILTDHGWKYDPAEYREALNVTKRQRKYFDENDNKMMLYVVK